MASASRRARSTHTRLMTQVSLTPYLISFDDTGILTQAIEDQRSIANRLAAEEKKEHEGESDDKETALSKKDPTLPVR